MTESTETTPPASKQTPSQRPPSTNRWTRFVTVWLAPLTVGLVFVFATAYAFVWTTEYLSRVRHLSYRITKNDAIMPTDKVGGVDLEITANGQQVDNLSLVTIELFNKSDHSFTDIELTVDFSVDDITRKSFDTDGWGLLPLSETDIQGYLNVKSNLAAYESTIPDYGSAIHLLQSAQNKIASELRSSKEFSGDVAVWFDAAFRNAIVGLDISSSAKRMSDFDYRMAVQRHYRITVANHGDASIFKATYIFAAPKAPDVKLIMIEDGLDLVELPELADSQYSFFDNPVPALVGGAIGGFLALLFSLKYRVSAELNLIADSLKVLISAKDGKQNSNSD